MPGLRRAHHLGALAVLVALVGIDVVDDGALADRLAAGDLGYQAQPSGVEHEALLHGALAGDRDLAGEIGAPEGDVDHVLAGLEPDERARLAVGGDEPGLAVGPGPVAKDAPDEALIDALPVLGQQGHERELAAAGGGRDPAWLRGSCAARPWYWAAARWPARWAACPESGWAPMRAAAAPPCRSPSATAGRRPAPRLRRSQAPQPCSAGAASADAPCPVPQ